MPQYLCFDSWALGIFRIVRKAVDDWIDAKAATDHDRVERFLAVQLGCVFTDLRRFAHFAMRGAQFLESLTPAHRSLFDKERREANAWELAAGLHWWLRQVSLHAGFYHFWAAHKNTSAGAGRPEDAMAQLLAAAAPPSAGGARKLEGVGAVKHAIMTHPKLSLTEPCDTGVVRGWLLGKFRSKVENLAQAIKTAAEDLADAGLLRQEGEASKRGRKVLPCRKVTWDEVTGHDGAREEAERLQIPRCSFE